MSAININFIRKQAGDIQKKQKKPRHRSPTRSPPPSEHDSFMSANHSASASAERKSMAQKKKQFFMAAKNNSSMIAFCDSRGWFCREKKQDGSQPSHTSFAKYLLYIPHHALHIAYGHYAQDLLKGHKYYLCEIPGKHRRLALDFDFDDKISVEKVVSIVRILVTGVLYHFYPEHRDKLGCVIAISPHPSKNKLGVHVHFYNLVVDVERSKRIWMSMVAILKDQLGERKPPLKPWVDVLDEDIFENSLRMIGSRKLVECSCQKSSSSHKTVQNKSAVNIHHHHIHGQSRENDAKKSYSKDINTTTSGNTNTPTASAAAVASASASAATSATASATTTLATPTSVTMDQVISRTTTTTTNVPTTTDRHTQQSISASSTSTAATTTTSNHTKEEDDYDESSMYYTSATSQLCDCKRPEKGGLGNGMIDEDRAYFPTVALNTKAEEDPDVLAKIQGLNNILAALNLCTQWIPEHTPLTPWVVPSGAPAYVARKSKNVGKSDPDSVLLEWAYSSTSKHFIKTLGRRLLDAMDPEGQIKLLARERRKSLDIELQQFTKQKQEIPPTDERFDMVREFMRNYMGDPYRHTDLHSLYRSKSINSAIYIAIPEGPGSKWCRNKQGDHTTHRIYFYINQGTGLCHQKCTSVKSINRDCGSCVTYTSPGVPLSVTLKQKLFPYAPKLKALRSREERASLMKNPGQLYAPISEDLLYSSSAPPYSIERPYYMSRYAPLPPGRSPSAYPSLSSSSLISSGSTDSSGSASTQVQEPSFANETDILSSNNRKAAVAKRKMNDEDDDDSGDLAGVDLNQTTIQKIDIKQQHQRNDDVRGMSSTRLTNPPSYVSETMDNKHSPSTSSASSSSSSTSSSTSSTPRTNVITNISIDPLCTQPKLKSKSITSICKSKNKLKFTLGSSSSSSSSGRDGKTKENTLNSTFLSVATPSTVNHDMNPNPLTISSEVDTTTMHDTARMGQQINSGKKKPMISQRADASTIIIQHNIQSRLIRELADRMADQVITQTTHL
jgi:hypothetical protein